jgi:hypothetical protein
MLWEINVMGKHIETCDRHAFYCLATATNAFIIQS